MDYLQYSNDGKKIIGVSSRFITYVEIPYGVTEIGSFAFHACTTLKTVIIPNSVIRIGSYSFEGCESLKSVEIPDSVTTIGDEAFNGCKNLESVVIPNSVTAIGFGAFGYCRSLYNIEIPESVHEVGEYALGEYTGWYNKQNNGPVYINDIIFKIKGICPETIIIREGTKTISDGAFAYCSTLQNLVMPNSLEKIGSGAFRGCKSLKSIILPDNIKEIGYCAFSGCTSLEEIVFPKDVTMEIGGKSFNNTKWLNDQEDGEVYINDVLYKFKGSAKKSTCVVKEGTKSIAPFAFDGCKDIQEIVIPECVAEIGDWAFCCCSNLKHISIPNSVKKINCGTFQKCTSLEAVDIPYSVKLIEKDAFEGCTSLAIIDIPSSVQEIGSKAFANCTSLFSIDLPNSIKIVGQEAFDNTKWYNDLSDGVVYLNKVLYKSKGDFKDIQLSIKDGTICIADCALESKNSINEIFLPNSLMYFGKFCLIGCKLLNTIHSHILKPEDIYFEEAFDFSFLYRYTLLVPEGTRWSYRHHPVFGQFSTIETEGM